MNRCDCDMLLALLTTEMNNKKKKKKHTSEAEKEWNEISAIAFANNKLFANKS